MDDEHVADYKGPRGNNKKGRLNCKFWLSFLISRYVFW